jgi:hypothetical protein
LDERLPYERERLNSRDRGQSHIKPSIAGRRVGSGSGSDESSLHKEHDNSRLNVPFISSGPSDSNIRNIPNGNCNPMNLEDEEGEKENLSVHISAVHQYLKSIYHL